VNSLRRSLGIRYKFGAGKIAMRRLISMTAFGFGFYYLWYNTDPTIEMVSLGAMGLAVLMEFAAPD
jgi:hypothetical protein